MMKTPAESPKVSNPSLTLRASSIGGFAYEHLRANAGRRAKIHSVFDSAMNVLVADRLLSIVSQSSDRGPLNLVVPLNPGRVRRHYSSLRPGDEGEVADHSLVLSSLHRVYFLSARKYSPQLTLSKPVVRRTDLEANLLTAARTGLSFGNLSGLGQLLGVLALIPGEPKEREELNIYARYALPRFRRLLNVLRAEGRKTDARLAVRDLIGLGPGLTPSSDDVLVGLEVLLSIYSINTHTMERTNQLISSAIAGEVGGATTRLSEEFLRQAIIGRCNESVARLCSAMLTEGTEAVAHETRRVLGLGGTSGTDVVLGVVLGATICAESSGEPVEKRNLR